MQNTNPTLKNGLKIRARPEKMYATFFFFYTAGIKSRVFKTLVRPTLEYCSTDWDPHTAKAALQLEMVQRWVVRWVKNDYVQQSSVTQMLIDLKWWGLEFPTKNPTCHWQHQGL